MDIRFGLEEYYGVLHCGDCFDVLIKDTWYPAQIEMGEDWYRCCDYASSLKGITNLIGLRVRYQKIF